MGGMDCAVHGDATRAHNANTDLARIVPTQYIARGQIFEMIDGGDAVEMNISSS